jgi:hypothetical protein
LRRFPYVITPTLKDRFIGPDGKFKSDGTVGYIDAWEFHVELVVLRGGGNSTDVGYQTICHCSNLVDFLEWLGGAVDDHFISQRLYLNSMASIRQQVFCEHGLPSSLCNTCVQATAPAPPAIQSKRKVESLSVPPTLFLQGACLAYSLLGVCLLVFWRELCVSALSLLAFYTASYAGFLALIQLGCIISTLLLYVYWLPFGLAITCLSTYGAYHLALPYIGRLQALSSAWYYILFTQTMLVRIFSTRSALALGWRNCRQVRWVIPAAVLAGVAVFALWCRSASRVTQGFDTVDTPGPGGSMFPKNMWTSTAQVYPVTKESSCLQGQGFDQFIPTLEKQTYCVRVKLPSGETKCATGVVLGPGVILINKHTCAADPQKPLPKGYLVTLEMSKSIIHPLHGVESLFQSGVLHQNLQCRCRELPGKDAVVLYNAAIGPGSRNLRSYFPITTDISLTRVCLAGEILHRTRVDTTQVSTVVDSMIYGSKVPTVRYHYTAGTVKGHSGRPIWAATKFGSVLCGIHSEHSELGFGVGAIITQTDVRDFHECCVGDDFSGEGVSSTKLSGPDKRTPHIPDFWKKINRVFAT